MNSIVSSHPHGSPPASQISLSDEFQRSIDTLMSYIPSTQLDLSPVRFNDADSAIAQIDHCVISAGGEVGSIEYQPNGSNDDKDLVPEEQMAVFVKLDSKDQVKLYLDQVSFNKSSIETQMHQLGLHCLYRKNNHPFPDLPDYAASIDLDMAIDYLFEFGVPVWSTLAYNYSDCKRTCGEKMLLRNRAKINAEIKVMKETASFFRAVGTRSEATQPKDLKIRVVIVANFAVLKPGEFIANLAVGATGNCQVNRLMNVIFNNYKILLEKGIINEEVYKSLIEGTFIFDAKVMFHKNKDASTENKGDFDGSQISGECGLLSEFKFLLNGSIPPVVIAVGKPAKHWLFSESIRNILLMKEISFYFVCHPHYVYTARGFNAVPGSATWFFRDCVVKSVERCGGFVEGATLDFTEQTESGRDNLTGLGLHLPSLGSTIAQKLEMNLYFLKTFLKINGHMRVPKEFPKMQGLHEFVAEMHHMILIDRLPPTELGDKLIATGFEEWSKPSEGFPNAPTHKWTEDEDRRILLNAQLAIGNKWNEIVLHLPGRTPLDICNRWRELNGKEISNLVDGLMTNGQRKWTEEEDRIILENHLSSGNKWSEENLIPGCTGKQIRNHWTNLSKRVAVYLYEKNIDSVHNIFNDNTKRFLLNSGDDVEQCLIKLRTQESVSKEISKIVDGLMASNAKKRPPSSELGNATKKKKVATKNQTAKKKTVTKKSST